MKSFSGCDSHAMMQAERQSKLGYSVKEGDADHHSDSAYSAAHGSTFLTGKRTCTSMTRMTAGKSRAELILGLLQACASI